MQKPIMTYRNLWVTHFELERADLLLDYVMTLKIVFNCLPRVLPKASMKTAPIQRFIQEGVQPVPILCPGITMKVQA
ncbi:hypothetical protein [Streptomyces sp. D54]|uniref:hypothetical protein n=1 Tax=Streptomyces sp. D54 TaxID=1290289 RepID=UPI003CECC54B